MAQTKQLIYSGVDRPILPYKTFTSPIDTSPHFTTGSQNSLALADGMLRKRPGFSVRLLRSPVNQGTVKRMMTWERWDGTFYIIISSSDGVNSYVYKAIWAVDLDPILIHTSIGNPQPFDFVISRNLLFMGNGVEMLKYDGTTVTKWGVDPPAAAPTLTLTGAFGAIASTTVSGGHVQTPTIISGGSGYNPLDPPQVTFTGGGGAGATATAVVTGSAVTGITITSPGVGYTSAPTVLITTGGNSAFTGYFYGYTYTTIYGHESNMSPLSLSTGLFTDQIVNVAYTASTDPQVNGINIYRTLDGGSQAPDVMQLVNVSGPLPNTTSSFNDATLDIDLGLQTGPALLRNSPPTPCIGFVLWNNRIWGFQNGTTFFSGNEEIANGVAEEAWPSGEDGNFFNWPERVMGMAPTPDQLAVGLSSQFWQVSGDSLDTFRIGLLLDERGVKGVTGIKSVGSDVIWQDRSRQLWTANNGEVGMPIRPDLATVDPSQSFVGMHVQNDYHWLYCLDPANSKLYLYDIDLGIWNTPWVVPGAVAITSGEVTVGNVLLIVAFANGLICWLDESNIFYNDNNTTYGENLVTNLVPCGTSGDATNRNRQEVGTPKQLEFETGPRLLDSVALLLDEDPTYANANWRDQLQGATTPTYQVPGQSLIKTEYKASYSMQSAQRAAIQFGFNVSTTPWTIYSMALAFDVTI